MNVRLKKSPVDLIRIFLHRFACQKSSEFLSSDVRLVRWYVCHMHADWLINAGVVKTTTCYPQQRFRLSYRILFGIRTNRRQVERATGRTGESWSYGRQNMDKAATIYARSVDRSDSTTATHCCCG